MHSWKHPTFIYRPRVAVGEVLGLEGVDVVEVVELVPDVRPSRNPSMRKGMSRVQKNHGFRVIGYCLTTASGHLTPPVMLLGHPTLCPVVLARSMRPFDSTIMSSPVFSGSAHDGGGIFVPTPGMPTPPLVHAEPTMGPSPPIPYEEVVQIEQIPGEDIQSMEGLRRSRRLLVHPPDCGTGDDM